MINHLKQFSGNDQHDSQEFLNSLLDTIHEDANRVLEKPYVVDDEDEDEEEVEVVVEEDDDEEEEDHEETGGGREEEEEEEEEEKRRRRGATPNGVKRTERRKKKKKRIKYVLKEKEELMSRFHGHVKKQKLHSALRRHRTMSVGRYSEEEEEAEEKEEEEEEDSNHHKNENNYNDKKKQNSISTLFQIKLQTLEEVAKKAWHKHLLRNQSIVVDTFQGQFISTIFCLDCQQPSVKFDPFMFLATPIPLPPSSSFNNNENKSFNKNNDNKTNHNHNNSDYNTGDRDSRVIKVYFMGRVSRSLMQREIDQYMDRDRIDKEQEQQQQPQEPEKKPRIPNPKHLHHQNHQNHKDLEENNQLCSDWTNTEDPFTSFKPIQYLLAVSPHPETPCRDILEQISALSHVRLSMLKMVQILNHKVYRVLGAWDYIGSLGDEDLLVVYEQGIMEIPVSVPVSVPEPGPVPIKIKLREDREIVDGRRTREYMEREHRFTNYPWPIPTIKEQETEAEEEEEEEGQEEGEEEEEEEKEEAVEISSTDQNNQNNQNKYNNDNMNENRKNKKNKKKVSKGKNNNDNNSNNKKRKIPFLPLGSRVDAKDCKGKWFPGSVIDFDEETEKIRGIVSLRVYPQCLYSYCLYS